LDGPGLQVGAQALREALYGVGLPAHVREARWKLIGEWQNEGRLFISGGALMTEKMTRQFDELAALLASNLSPQDARVAADAIVKGAQLATRDQKMINGLSAALNNGSVSAFLRREGLAASRAEILVELPYRPQQLTSDAVRARWPSRD